MGKKERNYSSPYSLDGRLPLRSAVPLGMQHVLAMFVGNVTAPIIICSFCGIVSGSPLQITILQNAMLVAGLVTLLQLYPVWKFGARLPIVMGTSAGYIGVYISVAVLLGGGVPAYGTILGATLLGGLVEILIGFFFERVRKLFPPLVIGTVLLAVGLSLVPIGINTFAGGAGVPDYGSTENLVVAFIVFLTVVAFKHFTKGMLSNVSILIGILVGYITVVVMGLFLPHTFMYTDPTTGVVSELTKSWVLNWAKVAEAPWFSLPTVMPVKITFDLRAILPICLIFVAMTIETMASVTAITDVGLGRPATNREMSGGLICDGFGSSFAALFGVLPNTAFAQNAGIINMTKVVNRFSVAIGAIFLVLCGFFPKLVAVISIMPQSVLGGSVALMFGSIMVSGLELISKGGYTARACTIVAASIGLGYGLGADKAAMVGFPAWVQMVVGGSGVITTAFLAILLNLIIPKEQVDRDLEQTEQAALHAGEAANAETTANETPAEK